MSYRTISAAILIAAACAGDTGEVPPSEPGDTSAGPNSQAPAPADTAGYPAEVPVDWDVASLPPAEALAREGACPFECCQYGEWWSDSATVVYRNARDTSDVAFTVPARTAITAEAGTVFVTSLARVVFDAPMNAEQIGVPGVDGVTPADTLYLLEPIGEGSFIVWFRGREQEMPAVWESYYPGSTGRMEGEHAHEWWARIRTEDGREGWVWMDRTRAPMWGADACGGEHPLD